MGALIAYELCKKIKAMKEQMPLHLFISGCDDPDVESNDPIYHNMPYEQLKSEIINMGGTPPELFEYRELEEIFLTILRNDFRIVETYKNFDHDIKIDTDITVFYGNEDMKADEVIGWRKQTEKNCFIYEFCGDHFFINNHLKQIINIICNTLEYYV